MTSNLVIRRPERERNAEATIPDAFLDGVFQYGDARTVASALGIGSPRMTFILAGGAPSCFEQCRRAIQQLRRNGNPLADEPFLRLSRELGFTSFRNDVAPADDERLVQLIHEFADVMETRAEVDADGVRTPQERRKLAKQAFELSEAALAYAREQLQRAGEAR